MGIIACLLFGLIGAWITRSLLADTISGSVKPVLFIGLTGGVFGMLGTLIGWGDLKSFNLYNVLLAIACSAVITFVYSRLQPRPKLSE